MERMKIWDGLLCFLLVAFACMKLPLLSGLWLDETLTVWIASGSAHDAWRRAITFQGQSPLYYELVWLLLQILTPNDCVVRLLSIGFGVGSLLVLRQLFQGLVAVPYVGTIIFAVALSSDVFQRAFISARPYSMAIFFTFVSVYYFWMAITRCSRRDVAFWIVASIISVYTHYLFGVVLLFEVLISLILRRCFRSVVVGLLVISISLLPGLMQLISLADRAGVLHFAALPTVGSILSAMFPIPTVVIIAISLLLASIWGGMPSSGKVDRKLILIALVWSCAPVLLFAGVSLASGHSIFTSRYWSWHIGGITLVVAIVAASFTSKVAIKMFVGALVCGCFFRVATQHWVVEGWREVGFEISRQPETSVLLYSGLIEGEDPSFVERDKEAYDYLIAPLTKYGVTRPIVSISLPKGAVTNVLWPQSPFILVSAKGARNGVAAPDVFLHSLAAEGRQTRVVVQSGTVSMYSIR